MSIISEMDIKGLLLIPYISGFTEFVSNMKLIHSRIVLWGIIIPKACLAEVRQLSHLRYDEGSLESLI